MEWRGVGFSFGFIVVMFFFAEHEDVDGNVIHFSERFKIFQSSFSETIFEAAVLRLRDTELVCNKFLFEIMKDSELTDFRIADHSFKIMVIEFECLCKCWHKKTGRSRFSKFSKGWNIIRMRCSYIWSLQFLKELVKVQIVELW
jgi:hypothetical protein